MRLLLGFLLFGLWASFARYYYVCEIKKLCGNEEVVEEIVPQRAQTLSLNFGDSTILEGYNQFYFQPRISQPTMDSNNYKFLEKIADFLNEPENEDKKLKIIGRFLESESDITYNFDDNIGITRAKAIEKLLADKGVSEDIISLDYSMVQGDTLIEPILFEILMNENTDLVDVQFTFTNMTFTESNFKFNSDVFEPKESFLLYADSMKTFFELNPEKTLTIIGHTDKLGTQAYNKGLGYRRANSAKLFLANQVGLQTEIKIESKGEKEPMASNNTPEGQSKNRRVNFVIE